jgi:hypothetical protein
VKNGSRIKVNRLSPNRNAHVDQLWVPVRMHTAWSVRINSITIGHTGELLFAVLKAHPDQKICSQAT